MRRDAPVTSAIIGRVDAVMESPRMMVTTLPACQANCAGLMRAVQAPAFPLPPCAGSL
jgi:hypothetical protein